MIRHRKPSILYVDDTMEQRYAMRRILETEGFDVFEAGTGKDALRLVEHKPSIAVVDVRLPDMSGYELSRQLKQVAPHLKLLQISASFSDPDLRAGGLSGGADAYIAQPVHPVEFVTLVRRMLDSTEAEDALRFLAMIGPRISSSLSLEETAKNIHDAIVPHFADRCYVFIERYLGEPSFFWPREGVTDEKLSAAIRNESSSKSVRMSNPRLLIAPLIVGDSSLGAIAFELDQNREYTATDGVLAEDLANRAALAIQNCILFASERLARSALIQSEKLATAGRMAAAIAHEINNPLEALTNLIYILEHSEESTPAVRQMASAALNEVTRLAHITRQSLGFYRELRAPSILNLSQSVEDTVDLYKKRFFDKNISIQLNLADNVSINGIKGEIRQVLSNLLVNALQAMEEGGKIVITTAVQDGKAILSIADSGSGIPDAVLERIFEPFYTTKQGTGTGLGLWISHSIIEKHGGKINVETSTNPEKHGTTFQIEFDGVIQ